MNFETAPTSAATEERKGSNDTSGAAGGGRNANKNFFPFTLLYKLHDQMDEIVDIDTNYVLDMYVTISRDGTVALRCMRTSHLWQHFLLVNKLVKEDIEVVVGLSKIFKQVYSIKLSCHGYIIVVGQSLVQKLCRFLVFSLNGDLLRVVEELKVEVKSVFLNSREDYLCVAANYTMQG